MRKALGSEKHCDYASDAPLYVVGADGREAHALGEADDLCHGANVAATATHLPTMINGVFQGEA
ncbi:hypothetical protein FEO92_08140 [Stenotrophomonas maltophilia]|uniref:hypothetical protein n=1 Tax=Stenotrophomonas maltophilia TaxID=40324 RepID=UPI0012B00C59|nr:hypothetical protein [Stenotrophomonas maltophilia]QGL92342.1 hypothetical protein FEO92_08140 [Stenotrophomonas maltophilia]